MSVEFLIEILAILFLKTVERSTYEEETEMTTTVSDNRTNKTTSNFRVSNFSHSVFVKGKMKTQKF